jgi:hypothetical protein
MDAHHSKTEANHGELTAAIEVLMDVSQKAAEVYPGLIKGKESTSGEMNYEAVHEEIPKQEAAVKSFGALKKRHLDRYLIVGRRGKSKERAQVIGGSQKKLAAVRRGTTRREGVAWSNGKISQGSGWNNVAGGDSEGRTDQKRCWKGPESKEGTRDRGLREQLRLGSKEDSTRPSGKPLDLRS